jgi:hypothetical protein
MSSACNSGAIEDDLASWRPKALILLIFEDGVRDSMDSISPPGSLIAPLENLVIGITTLEAQTPRPRQFFQTERYNYAIA